MSGPKRRPKAWRAMPPPEPWMQNRGVHILDVVGRLAAGVDASAAAADLAVLVLAGRAVCQVAGFVVIIELVLGLRPAQARKSTTPRLTRDKGNRASL